jgi:DNA-binding protein WhiA
MNVKNELSLQDNERNMEMIELSAFIRNNGKYEDNKIVLSTENNKVAKHIYILIKKMFNVVANIIDKNNSFNRSRLLLIEINQKVDNILKDLYVLSEDNKYLSNVPDFFVDNEDDKRAYLRGVFLATGSVNDPKTSRYHLEFFINDYEEAKYISSLLNEFYLNSKIIKKEKKYMVYVKEAEKIGDFLRVINAPQAVMYYEDIRIYRDHKNMTNRLNNMEQANIERIINTCNEQIEDIHLILDTLGEQFLDEKTLEAATYRLKYPESSLQELSDIMEYETDKPITKSGLNHRFRKIKEIANRIRSEKK